MPDGEFDLWMSVLRRLLRTGSRRGDEIADELRDHFRDRLQELAASGVPRDEAVRRCLQEFGDAAGLAAEFTKIASLQRRRWTMRVALGSVVLVGAAWMIPAMWPQTPGGGLPAAAVAQQRPEKPSERKIEPAKAPAAADETAARLMKKLTITIPETPLADALAFLADRIEVDLVLDRRALEAVAVDADTPVTLILKRTPVTAAAALDLLLDQAGRGTLGYAVRDGVVHVTLRQDTNEIRVYNVRDLAQNKPAPVGGAAAEAMFAAGVAGARSELVSVVIGTIRPDSWLDNGGGGSISEYTGLLVIKQTPAIHREVEGLLNMMRIAAAAEPKR